MAVLSKLIAYFSAGQAVPAQPSRTGTRTGGSGFGRRPHRGRWRPAALLDAAIYLTDHPDVSNQFGRAGREYACRLLGVESTRSVRGMVGG
jgi:hypothetical protein